MSGSRVAFYLVLICFFFLKNQTLALTEAGILQKSSKNMWNVEINNDYCLKISMFQ